MNGNGHAKHDRANGDVSVDVDGEGEMSGDDRGMVLPFSPITITFRDIHYFVPLPAVRVFFLRTGSSHAPPNVSRL